MQWLAANRWARRALSSVSAVLAVVGVGMLAYPFATNLYQSRLQDRLEAELVSSDLLDRYAAGRLSEGDALTRLRIPATGVDVVVVEGTSSSALRAGAGHYPATALPGEEGNVAIAGHRTTYGRPFHDNDKLRKGDDVILDTPVGQFRYRVMTDPFVVESRDWTPIANVSGRSVLTLTACHPKGSARQRLVVRAELVPKAAAR
jgi:sortase A